MTPKDIYLESVGVESPESAPTSAVAIPPTMVEHATLPSLKGSDRRLHILFLIDRLPAMGGGEGALLKIVRYLPRDKFRCSLATLKPSPLVEIFRQAGCTVQVYSIKNILSLDAFRAARSLRDFMRLENVDIVHTFFETSNLWGGLVTKLGGGPLLASSRRDMGILRSAKHHLAYKLLHPLFDSVVAVSAPVRDACIQDEGISPDRVVILHNGVEMEKFGSLNGTLGMRAHLGVLGASHVITSVGHIRRFKGFDVLIRAAAKVCREFPKAVFVIVGDFYQSDYIRELLQLMRDLGVINNIRFAGPLGDVTAALGVSDVFCLLSRTEGFSNALVEAMACGLPTVATRVGGAEETISDGHDGFLVNNEDADTAAERILFLLRNRDAARKMGVEARETVKTKFTAEIMCRTLSEHYDHLVRTRPSSRWWNRSLPESSARTSTASCPVESDTLYRARPIKRRARFFLKWVWIRFLWFTGLLAFSKWWIKRHGAVVLSFHRILRSDAAARTTLQKGMIVKDDTFCEVLRYLHSHCSVIDLAQGSQQPQRERPQVAITFDDGWEDNASTALRVASEFKTPFTVFICPGLMDRSLPFWPEKVLALVRSAERLPDGISRVAAVLRLAGYSFWAADLMNGADDRAEHLAEQIKTLAANDRDLLLERLFTCGVPTETVLTSQLYRTMSWDQVKLLNHSGITIGSHTHHHEILTHVPIPRIQQEIGDSQAAICQNLNKNCELFSYPNGDASPVARDLISRSGFRLAFINSPGVWRREGDPFLIPRINLWESHLTTFGGKFSKLAFEYSVFWRAFTHRRAS